MFLFGLILGSIEVVFIIWLLLMMLSGSGWAIIGFIAYTIFTFFIGNTLLKYLLTIISSSFLAFIFLYYGLLAAIIAFIIIAIIFEFLPRED
jgi:hypothetical protein